MSRPARFPLHFPLACIAACALALSAVPSRAQPGGRIHELAQQEKAPLLDTLRDLVNIESGSKDAEGLARLAALIGERLTRLGGKVEIVEPTDIYRMDDTPPKPGITGLWQVCRHDRSAGDFHQWIEYDVMYVQHGSFWLDLKILLATVLTLGGKKHVRSSWLVRQRSHKLKAGAPSFTAVRPASTRRVVTT